MASHRPSKTSMEGFIFNADAVLTTALSPEHDPAREKLKELTEACKGIAILSIKKVGAILTFYYGTGVLIKKKEDGSWSAPSSLSAGGYSMGAVAGAKTDNVLVFIKDDETLQDFIHKVQTRMGLTSHLALGSKGGDKAVGIDAKGTESYVLTSGVFGGFALELGTMGVENNQNKVFYKRDVSANGILNKDRVEIDPESQIPDLHRKLDMLQAGTSWTPSEDDIAKSSRHGEMAKQASIRFATMKAQDIPSE